MTNLTSDERERRLKQIRDERAALDQNVPEPIGGGFVMPWGNRQITEREAIQVVRRAIASHCPSELRTKTELLMLCYEYRKTQSQDAATRMRDKCVAGVRGYLTDCHDEERGIIEAIALELESLTLDQTEGSND